jgi:hypothetical protein
MTVRTWITISVAVVVALCVAVVLQFTLPVHPPEIIIQAAGARLTGALEASCWPQRSGDLKCTRHDPRPKVQRIAPRGSLRVILVYPAKATGTIRIDRVRDGHVVLRSRWKPTVPYKLAPGRYLVTAQAGALRGAYVRYVFALTVTRSGD